MDNKHMTKTAWLFIGVAIFTLVLLIATVYLSNRKVENMEQIIQAMQEDEASTDVNSEYTVEFPSPFPNP